MSFNIDRRGIVTSSIDDVTNLYSGKQYNCNAGTLTYNYQTDVFKEYGFDTALKWTAPTDKGDNAFLAYSFLLDSKILYDISQEYVVSLYSYVSDDCNAKFRMRVEGDNQWASSNLPIAIANKVIYSDIKGKPQWVWAKCKASSKDGHIQIMFYPNTNEANIFTSGYQLFAGISVYLGNKIYRPFNNQISGSGLIQTDSNVSIGKNNIIAHDFIEI